MENSNDPKNQATTPSAATSSGDDSKPTASGVAAPPVQATAQAKPVSPPAAKPAVAPAVKKPKQDRAPEDDHGIWRISRRNFFSVAGWAAFFVFIATSTVGALRMMFPRILYEPPSAFKAGFPQDYLVGE